MIEITEEMLEEFANGTSNIESVLGYYGLELDDRGGGEVDVYHGEVEIYAITTDLTLFVLEKLLYEWEEFVNYKGDDLYAEAEEFQIRLKECYDENYLDIARHVSSDLLDAFERFVANKHEGIFDFEHEFNFYVLFRISDNSFEPEDLIQARKKALANR